MKRVIGYTRVSTRAQGSSGLGLEAQRDAIERYCETRGYEIVRIDHEIASGALEVDSRPVLEAALKDAERGGCTLLVAKLCRLSRDSLLVKQMMRRKVDFEDADSGPDAGNLMLGLKAEFNEEERRKISERTKAALAAKRARGEPLGNIESLKAHRARGSATVASSADDFAEAMRPALEAIEAWTMSAREVARQLNLMRIPSRTGGPWSHKTTGRLLKRLEVA